MNVRMMGFYEKNIKRIIDIIISLLMLIVLFPVIVLSTIIIKLDSKGPVLFVQERLGKNLEIFNIYKFRTMVENAVFEQKIGQEVLMTDKRITKTGKFLRRFKIDELPQLFNVIKGDMSLVGPRPTLPEYAEIFEEWEKARFDVKPGLTGMAQVNGNIYLTRQQKSEYDIQYAKNISFINDMKIIFKTLLIVAIGEQKFIDTSMDKRNERGVKQ